MVVEVPNAVTEQRSLYVMEVTQDLDGMLDMFFMAPRNGISLFPLMERFHNYFGNAIWWLPLKVMSKRTLGDWIFFFRRLFG